MQDREAYINELYFKILALAPQTQRDLKRMWRVCKDLLTEISKEDVNCRRFGKDTPKKKELVQKLDDSVNTLEQYLVFASLLG
jgi:hypothetical protein